MHEAVHVQRQTNKYFAFVRLYASVSIKLLFLALMTDVMMNLTADIQL